MSKEVYRVTMFDEFTISYGEDCVNVKKYLGKQLVNLFQVLLYYRHQPIHKEKLIEILWQESENPSSVMKFTIFRLRNDIHKIPFFEGKDLIVTTKEGYQLNPEFEWQVDYEEFNAINEELANYKDYDSRALRKGYRIVDLYQGKYYVSNSQLMWTVQRCEYYRQAYVKVVIKMCKFLLENQRYDEMMSLNYKAIMFEPFYEGLHYYYMKGLLETSDYHKALKYYDDLNEAFLRELGTGLSDRFKELYDVIMQDHEDVKRLEMKHLLSELSSRTDEGGGFYCTFEMFKYIYELNVKVDQRSENGGHYLISLEIINEEDENHDDVYEITNRVKKLIASSLRNSDVFAKVNEGQFVVLADCKTLDNAYLIIQRISKKFYNRFRNKGYRMNYNVTEAVFVDEE